MRNLTKLMLTLALLVAGMGGAKSTKLYATYGTPASEGVWNSETNTYTWTKGWSNLMSIFTFSNGELANYTSLHFTTSTYTSEYRLYFHGPDIQIVFYSADEKNIVFAERAEFNGVDLSTITGISFGGQSESGSIVITGKPYLQKPMSLTWDDNGYAEIDITDLTASDGFSLNDQTGELTSTGSSGELSINLPAGGVDLSSLTGFSVTYTGDNVLGGFKIGISDEKKKDFYSNPTGRDDLASHMTTENVGNPSAIKLWKWWNNSTASTMTITSIKLKANVVTACLGEEVAMSTLTNYHKNGDIFETTGYTPNYRVNESVTAAYFGVDWNGEKCENYSDVEGYKAIRVYSAQGNVPRAMFFNNDASGQTSFNFNWNEAGYYELSLSTVYSSVNNYKLISIRPAQSTSGTITAIYMVSSSSTYDYVISGSGTCSTSSTAALADATATSIDATGITVATSLATANPNCLIVANSGMVTNTNNVIVDGACASFALTDGKPFKAPVAFTATAAPTYSRSFVADKITTVCLPFALTAAEAATLGTFYTLSIFDGSTLHFTSVDAPAANTPYLVVPTTTALTLSETNKSIAITPASQETAITNIEFIGTLASTKIPASDATYSYYAYNNGGLVKITTNAATLPAFRAYFKVETAAINNASRSIGISFDDESTGISSIQETPCLMQNDVYDLQGRRVAKPEKGLYVVNGKKVVIK